METAFTPLPALAGGIMIGLAAVLLLLADGRIAGISGILGGLFAPSRSEFGWRLAFVLGLPAGAAAVAGLGGTPPFAMEASGTVAILAGFLVGYGSRLGSGCTSGHGVCGLARLSPRSLAATATFLATAMLTVFLVRHAAGL
ncbi:MAG: YeeE/YedE family protein [Alphaproteobacteria bacterium]